MLNAYHGTHGTIITKTPNKRGAVVSKLSRNASSIVASSALMFSARGAIVLSRLVLVLLLPITLVPTFAVAAAQAATADEDELKNARTEIETMQKEMEGLRAAHAKEREEWKKKEEKEQQQHQEDEDRSRNNKVFYADRLVRDMLDTINDQDCMSGELDAGDPKRFDAEKAARVFEKCRLLVVRNLFPRKEVLEPYKRKVTSYLDGIKSGRVSPTGTTTLGDPFFYYETSAKRWEVVFSDEAIEEGIVANNLILDVLRNERVLGDNLKVLDLGGIIAESGAPVQYWHIDGDIYDDIFETTGTAGHDIAPFDVGIILPLMNLTRDHGPTEFCLGSTNVVGLDENSRFRNETLKDHFHEYLNHVEGAGACPPHHWRAPLLNFGDALFFAFNILHRGGENRSPDMRFIVYNTYARSWFLDANYDGGDGIDYAKKKEERWDANYGEMMKWLMRRARVALPDKVLPEDPKDASKRTLSSLEKLNGWRPATGLYVTPPKSEGIDSLEIVVSNIDVEYEGLKVCIWSSPTTEDGGKDICYEEEAEELSVGRTLVLPATSGDVARVVKVDGTVLRTWKVEPQRDGRHHVILQSGDIIEESTSPGNDEL